MSRPDRSKYQLKKVAKEWTAWQRVPLTPAITMASPQMRHVSSIYANSRFEVQVFIAKTSVGGVSQIVIARHGHLEEITWNDCQRIKNELFGADALAIEIYPREVTPMMKVRILWVMPAGYELPCGLDKKGAWGDNGD